MMLMPNKKKAVTLIIGGMKPDFVQKMGDRSFAEGPKPAEEEETDYSLALKDASRKIISAIHEKDEASFADYMKEFIYMCQHDQEEPMDDEYMD
jgi:hypothetical protein